MPEPKYGSSHRRALILSLGKHYRHLVNLCQDLIHQTSAKMIKQSALIATEELSIKNMTAKGGDYKKALNREILNTSAAAFIATLKYKAEEAGINWVEIPTRQVKPAMAVGYKLKKHWAKEGIFALVAKAAFGMRMPA